MIGIRPRGGSRIDDDDLGLNDEVSGIDEGNDDTAGDVSQESAVIYKYRRWRLTERRRKKGQLPGKNNLDCDDEPASEPRRSAFNGALLSRPRNGNGQQGGDRGGSHDSEQGRGDLAPAGKTRPMLSVNAGPAARSAVDLNGLALLRRVIADTHAKGATHINVESLVEAAIAMVAYLDQHSAVASHAAYSQFILQAKAACTDALPSLSTASLEDVVNAMKTCEAPRQAAHAGEQTSRQKDRNLLLPLLVLTALGPNSLNRQRIRAPMTGMLSVA